MYQHSDLGHDLGLSGGDQLQETLKKQLSDKDFREMVRSLNTEQREIFNHVLHAANKVSDTQQFIFLSGGAGVGKTPCPHITLSGPCKVLQHRRRSEPRSSNCSPDRSNRKGCLFDQRKYFAKYFSHTCISQPRIHL